MCESKRRVRQFRRGRTRARDVAQFLAMDHKGLAADERHELADLLSGLTAAQWDATSLCGQWPVRDVAAHVITYLDRDRLDWTTAIALHRLDIDRLNATDVERSAELAPGDIV